MSDAQLKFKVFLVQGPKPLDPGVLVISSEQVSALWKAVRESEHLSKFQTEELYVEHKPNLDHLAAKSKKARVITGETPDEQRIFRELGWGIAGMPSCACCELDEWPLVPESKLENGECSDCRAKKMVARAC